MVRGEESSLESVGWNMWYGWLARRLLLVCFKDGVFYTESSYDLTSFYLNYSTVSSAGSSSSIFKRLLSMSLMFALMSLSNYSSHEFESLSSKMMFVEKRDILFFSFLSENEFCLFIFS